MGIHDIYCQDCKEYVVVSLLSGYQKFRCKASVIGLKVANLFLTIWTMTMEYQVPRTRNKSPTLRPNFYLPDVTLRPTSCLPVDVK